MSSLLKHWYRLLQKAKDDTVVYYHYRGGLLFKGMKIFERDYKEVLHLDGEINEPKIGFKRPRKIDA